MDWVGYFDGAPSVYVCDRHRAAHYALVAEGIAALVPPGGGTVLDYGCGEALSAGRVAEAAGRLLLCDAAPAVRTRLSARHGGDGRIVVLAPADLSSQPAGSVDLVVAHSVIQYLDAAALCDALAAFRRLLSPDGRIVIGDVIPPSAGAAGDALALLSFARREGFLGAALLGLARTAFSDYRRLRGRLGLARHAEDGFVALMGRHGLSARRIRPNLGHDQRRMAFELRPAPAVAAPGR